MARILVIGGTGFIGRSIVDRLSKSGHKCFVGTRTLNGINRNNQVIVEPFLPIHINSKKIDLIVNASGYYTKQNTPIEKLELQKGNVGMTKGIMHTAIKYNLPVIALGTYFEKSPISSEVFNLEYTKSKIEAKKIIAQSVGEINRNCYYIYLYDTYGKFDHRNKVVNYIISSLINNVQPIFNNQESVMNWSSAGDVSLGIENTVSKALTESGRGFYEYQIRSKDEFSISDLLSIVNKNLLNDDDDIGNKIRRNLLWQCASDIPGQIFGDYLVSFIVDEIKSGKNKKLF